MLSQSTQSQAVELNNVIYNAATQSFEALATVYAGTSSRSFACAIDAPIDMSFEDAAAGLTTQALRRFEGRGGLSSTHPLIKAKAQVRAVPTPVHQPMDAFEMLRQIAA